MFINEPLLLPATKRRLEQIKSNESRLVAFFVSSEDAHKKKDRYETIVSKLPFENFSLSLSIHDPMEACVYKLNLLRKHLAVEIIAAKPVYGYESIKNPETSGYIPSWETPNWPAFVTSTHGLATYLVERSKDLTGLNILGTTPYWRAFSKEWTDYRRKPPQAAKHFDYCPRCKIEVKRDETKCPGCSAELLWVTGGAVLVKSERTI